jgi:flagellar motor switch protein FliG
MQPSALTGPQKAVLMLLSLDEATATPILAEMDPEDVKKLRDAAAGLRAVPTTSLDGLYAEFIERSRTAVAVPKGGVRYLRRLAGRALGEPAAQQIFLEAEATAIQKLAQAEPGALASVMETEHPQLVAAILSQLDNEKAARVLEALPEASRPAILERLGTMSEVPASLLEDVANALSAELPVAQSGGVMGSIEEGNSELAGEIRKAMYTFEDLNALDARALRSLLESVPVERLTMALKTASETLKTHIFASMSKRAAERIKEDMEIMGGVRLSDVEAAQREIVEVALRLDAEGTISLENNKNAMV